MDFLFTKQDIFLLLAIVFYAGLTIFQLQKMLFLSQSEQGISPLKSLFFVGRVVIIVPLLLTINCLV